MTVRGYQDLAAVLRRGIEQGEYPPGSTLPTLQALEQQYGLSRKTVQAAIRLLRAEGLVDPIRKRGTVVREAAPARVIRQRKALRGRTLGGYWFGDRDGDDPTGGWRAVRPPEVDRRPAPADIAHVLAIQPGVEVVVRDREIGDPDTGQTHQIVTSYLHPDLVAELPILGAKDTGFGGIYDRMEEAGHDLSWAERVGTRPPTPAEVAALSLPEGVAILRVLRITSDQHDAVCEVADIRMSGALWALEYPVARAPEAAEHLRRLRGDH